MLEAFYEGLDGAGGGSEMDGDSVFVGDVGRNMILPGGLLVLVANEEDFGA